MLHEALAYLVTNTFWVYPHLSDRRPKLLGGNEVLINPLPTNVMDVPSFVWVFSLILYT